MPPKRRKVPAYCLHKATGQAVVRIDGKDFYLGKYGTEASHEAYQRLVAQFVTIEKSCRSRSQLRAVARTVNELILVYWKHAEQYYCKAGQASSELHTIRQALRPLRVLYGHVSADEFGPVALKTVRQRMIEIGWARKHINKQADRIKRMFK